MLALRKIDKNLQHSNHLISNPEEQNNQHEGTSNRSPSLCIGHNADYPSDFGEENAFSGLCSLQNRKKTPRLVRIK